MYRITRKFAWKEQSVRITLSPRSPKFETIQFEHYYIVQQFWQGAWQDVGLGYLTYEEAYPTLEYLIKQKP